MHSQFRILGPLLLAGLVGCGGGGPATTNVGGTLTASGEPVNGGQLVFYPEGEDLPPSIGKVGEDGSFELTMKDGKGAVLGKHKVLYTAPVPTENEDGTVGAPSKFAGWGLPDDFTVEVTDSTESIDIELVKQR